MAFFLPWNKGIGKEFCFGCLDVGTRLLWPVLFAQRLGPDLDVRLMPARVASSCSNLTLAAGQPDARL
jgi:hypothetical protein